MKKTLMIITKVYFFIPYIFLIYKLFSKNDFNLFEVILLIFLVISLYNILNNKKWIYKFTVIITSCFLITIIPFTFLTSSDKEYISIYSKQYSDILGSLFLFGFIILYYFYQKNLTSKKDE